MATAKYAPTTKMPVHPDLPKIATPDYKGSVVDDRYQSLYSMTAFVDGYPLTVDAWYGQILGVHNDVRELDPSQSSVDQQYYVIKKFDIRVDQPLEMSYDDNKAQGTITGSANIYPVITPNTYDYFVAKSTRGRATLFRITNVTRRTLNRDSIHLVDYQMVGYIDEGTARTLEQSLVSKVKRTYYFHGERLHEGLMPLLKEEESNAVFELERFYIGLTNYYFETFWNRRFCTIVVPGQEDSIYDAFLTNFLLKFVDTQDSPYVIQVKQYGMDNDKYAAQPQFWKGLATRMQVYIDQGNRFMGVASRQMFNRDNYIAGGGLVPFQYYVYPVKVDTTTNVNGDPTAKGTSGSFIGTGKAPGAIGGNCLCEDDSDWEDAFGSTPLYKRVQGDRYYVLSRDFYEKTGDLCILEKCVSDYMAGRQIQLNELVALVRKYYDLPRLEQFYYGPVLILLVRACRYNQYT